MHGLGAAMAAGALAGVLAGGAAWAKAPPAWVQNHNQRNASKVQPPEDESMKPSSRLRDLEKSITLSVGEKQSFRNVYMAGVVDPKVARIMVDDGVLTIRGLKTGVTTLNVYPASSGAPSAEALSKPKEIRVTVK